MKDENDEVHETLRRYCKPSYYFTISLELIDYLGVSWTQAFDINNKPHFVLSSTYKSSLDCNYAVCFGIGILLPSYLNELVDRLRACWKKVADSQDSFVLPNAAGEVFQPKLDPALPKSRSDAKCWLPDPRRADIFRGWCMMGLRGKVVGQERRIERPQAHGS